MKQRKLLTSLFLAAGEYAYWLAAGISVDYTKADVENCIQLFCKENLSE